MAYAEGTRRRSARRTAGSRRHDQAHGRHDGGIRGRHVWRSSACIQARPIAEWGFELDKKAIRVDTAKFQTSVPASLPSATSTPTRVRRRLILSGFHEAALAAFAIAEH